MKKWTKNIFTAFFVSLLSLHCTGQTETFDIIKYTAPANWKKDVKQGVVNYIHTNTSTGGFCVIALFASSAGSGDAMNDFTNSWTALVATPFQVSTTPQPEKQPTAEGWEIVAAAAPAKVDGADMYVILTVLSGFGKTVSIRASLNDQAYITELTAFLETVELDKNSKASEANTTTQPASNNTGNGTFGAMTYTPPQGWSHQVFQDGVVLKPGDLPQGEHLAIQIMQPLYSTGSLEQALRQSFDEATTMYNGTKMNYAGTGLNYQQTETKTSFRGWEYIRGSGGIRIGNPEFGLDLFVIRINNRFERVAILKSKKIDRSCSMTAFDTDARMTYRAAIDKFLFSLQFSDGQTAILQNGTIYGNGIIGVWQGISMQASASSGLRYNVFTPVFLSNGQAYFGAKFPSEGLDGLDTRIPAELHRRDWGTYTFTNGRGVLKMPYGDIPLRMESGKLIITANNTEHRFYQTASVDGARFNGTYVMNEAYGKIPAISFTTDGRFSDNGAIRVLYHEYNDCINPAIQPGSGTYAVKDHTITFHYSDGRKIKIAFTGAEYDKTNPSPSTILLSANEDRLQRK